MWVDVTHSGKRSTGIKRQRRGKFFLPLTQTEHPSHLLGLRHHTHSPTPLVVLQCVDGKWYRWWGFFKPHHGGSHAAAWRERVPAAGVGLQFYLGALREKKKQYLPWPFIIMVPTDFPCFLICCMVHYYGVILVSFLCLWFSNVWSFPFY